MKWALFLSFCFLSGALFFSSCSKPQPAAPVTFDWDKGPTDTVEAAIAKYPKDLQATYNQIVKVKCSACHPVARVLWAPYYDNDTWTKILNKMANRPGSQVTSDDTPKVLKFMEYDHQQRQAEIEKMFQDQHWEKKPPIGL